VLQKQHLYGIAWLPAGQALVITVFL